MRIFLAILPLVTITNAAPPDVVNQEEHEGKSPAFYEDYQEVTHMDFGMTFPLVSEDPAPWVRRVSRQVRWPNVNRVPHDDGDDDSDDQDDARDKRLNEIPAAAGEFSPSTKKKKGKRTRGQSVKSSSKTTETGPKDHGYNLRSRNRPSAETEPIAGPSGLQPPVPSTHYQWTHPLDGLPGTYVLGGPEQGPSDPSVFGRRTGAGVDCRQCQGSDCDSCDNPGPRCHVLIMREGRDSPRLFEHERVVEYQQEIFDPFTELPEDLVASVLTCCEDCPIDDCICSGDAKCEQFLAHGGWAGNSMERYRAFLEKKRKRSHRYVFGFSKKNWSDSKKFRDGEWTPEFHNTTTTTQRPDGGPPRRGSRGHRIELRNAPELARPTQLGRLFEALGIEPKPLANQYVDSIRDTVRSNPRWDNFEGTVEEYIWCLLQ